MKFNQSRIAYFLSTIAIALMSGALYANDDNPGVVTKVENAVEHGAHAAADGVERGAHAAANGIEKGAKATEHGVKRGVQATAKGVERAADATKNAANHVAEKVSGKPASSE